MKNDIITIIDLGIGNLGSIKNMILKCNGRASITNKKEDIIKAKKIILPGVGSFDKAMNEIHRLEIYDLLKDKAQIEKTPFFGICLGMQLLTNKSEEGEQKGLGLIDAEVYSFKRILGENEDGLRIPHMGWNQVKDIKESNYVKGVTKGDKYYFVHSYFVKCKYDENTAMTSQYGIDFHASIIKENIFGTQFHPEKSHKYGMRLIKNFIEL